jgi:hypothetical protein
MKRISCLPLIFLVASCSSRTSGIAPVETTQTPAVDATQGPAAVATEFPTITRIPDAVATLLAASPSLEATFDGSQCEFEPPNVVNVGEHVLLLHNHSGERSFLIAGRLYQGKTWEDFLEWFQANCGAPGSVCARTGEAPWIGWLFQVRSTGEDTPESRYQYQFDLEGQYLLVVTRSEGSVWPCGTFQVVAPQ